jgi:hypothetical protein
MHLVFDIETNGLMDRADDLLIHCIAAVDAQCPETGVIRFGPGEIAEGLQCLATAERLIGHNISQFDIPVIERLYPEYASQFTDEIVDTLMVSRMMYISNLFVRSIRMRNAAGRSDEAREARLPARLLKSHSLEAWGYRLKCQKDMGFQKVDGCWEQFTPEMLNYCAQDVETNLTLYRHLLEKPADRGWPLVPVEAMIAESKFARIIGRQERNGVRFNEKAASELYSKLSARREELTADLKKTFAPWYAYEPGQKGKSPEVDEVLHPDLISRPYTVPKANRTMKPTEERPWPVSYGAGRPHTKIKLVTFNPGSRHHIAERLQKLYGWEPSTEDYTPSGLPEINERILSNLDYPPIPQLVEYLLVAKRIGQCAEGDKAWLKMVTSEGLIHGRVHSTGCRTLRCSHLQPNLAQVPKVGKPYGVECRGLFSPTREGWVMAGIDASGLELRMLAHRLAFFDDGAFGEILLKGDPHSDWMKSTGIFIRDNQKTFTYAMLYGSGDENLGVILIKDWRQAYAQGLTKRKPKGLRYARALGKAARATLLNDVPALELLTKACKKAFQAGFVRGLDGCIVAVKTEYGVLNDVLQGDGARVMKYAALRFDEMLQAGLEENVDYAWMLNIHDEWQLECVDEPVAKVVGEMGCKAIQRAGKDLGIRVPLDGDFKVGSTWAETH